MIDIVLATYNGEAYLAEQLRSIQRNNHYHQWIEHIIVSDDGSNDNTRAIVEQFKNQDAKIIWLKNTNQIKGPKSNFDFGIMHSKADYIMLCDQDDIWLPTKIETLVQAIKGVEQKLGNQTPVLVFSDLQVVDQNLNEICPSYFKLKNISKDWHLKFEQLSQQNVVSGCSLICNRALINKALPIPNDAYMHDWWLAMVASRCGHIAFIDQGLTQYRQHNNNNIGANKRTKLDLCQRFFYHLEQFQNSIEQVIKQANAFKAFELENNLPVNNTIEALATIEQQNRLQRIKLLMNKTITRSHFAGRFALLIVLLKMEVKHTKISD